MKRAPIAAAVGAALALAIPASASSTSGLRGVVTRGPTQPVCQAGVPCDAPAPRVVLAFARAGHRTRTVRTDAHGRFRIALAPGRYALRIASARFGYTPRAVVVPRARFAVIRISIDTGIR